MKRLVACLGMAWLLACAGNALPCLATRACQPAPSCCDPTDSDHDRCPPEADCPCCPHLAPALPIAEVIVSADVDDTGLVPSAASPFRTSPDPREILHVPKLVPSFG